MVNKRGRSSSSVRSMESHRLGPWALGHSLGTVCSIFLFAAAFMSWVSASSYNADLIALQFPLSFSVFDWTIIAGFIQTYLFGYIAGVFIATFYNRALA